MGAYSREERDKSEWARERLRQHILDSFAFTDDALSLSIKATSVVRCDGDAKIVFSRGKKRCGYDMSVKFEYESTRLGEDDEGFPEATGHVELHDFDDTSGEEYEISVKAEGNSQHAKDARAAVQKWEAGLRKLLAAWKEELLQQ
jgi:activator of HSP90 ATPase